MELTVSYNETRKAIVTGMNRLRYSGVARDIEEMVEKKESDFVTAVLDLSKCTKKVKQSDGTSKTVDDSIKIRETETKWKVQ